MRYNFFLYHAFEFFKKYLGDQNIYKDYKLLWNLFLKKTPFKYSASINDKGEKIESIDYITEGNNILILEYSRDPESSNERIKLLTPLYANTIIDTGNVKYTLLLKYTDTFTGDDYFDTLIVDEYLTKAKLNCKTLAQIPDIPS